MADKKISALTAATTPLAGTEVLPIVQGGATVKVSVDNLTTGKPVSMSNLTYTGTLTGSTGVIAVGTNQIYKDASGNVGINTVTPKSKFHLTVGDVAPAASGDMNTGVIVETGYGARALNFGSHNSAGYSWVNAAFSNNSGVSDVLVLMTGTTERVRIATDTTVSNGNLVIGTAGKGIDFSADGQAAGMTSELLDDYEEGTWTPVLNAFTGAASSVVGRYTKVGNLVKLYGYFIPTTTIASVSAVSNITGLPFAPALAGNIVSWSVDYTGQLNSINVASALYAPTVSATAGFYYFSATYSV